MLVPYRSIENCIQVTAATNHQDVIHNQHTITTGVIAAQ